MQRLRMILVVAMFMLCGCSEKGIDFAKIGVTEEYYNDTKLLMEKYSSEEMKVRVDDIYSNFGDSDYDYKELKKETDKIESEINRDYYEVFKNCDNDKDKDMILFGYHYSLLNLMNFGMKAMDDPDHNYDDTLIKYDNEFGTLNSSDIFDDFCLFITKNKIMDYSTSITKLSQVEVASTALLN